eukprot:CAMPEP_0196579474 /NCGR_PEP_ID=MMETSP1081-20130531/22015_1 /TAXON_ID=36882 /ORGANISM="Pyramimonas amylifera, Strain CCMP720" /LENGTH=457 /DNA_ID=CAMNT_0041899081 /DNA_START=148 /DNA_END=1521 /DNA_ORIENTATION=+
MKGDGLSEAAIAAFKINYEALVSGASTEMPEEAIMPVGDLPTLEKIQEEYSFASAPDGVDILGATAVLKLNGGLGTSMGLEKAKSLLLVKNNKTFLDLIADQVKFKRRELGAHVRFILMNSFSTADDTKASLSAAHADLVAEEDWELLQNKSPKILAEDMSPASWPNDSRNEWCPPGHGDIYASLLGSGMMDRLLASGIKYLFVSNSDNLGATLDLDLLLYVAKTGKSFVMEVAARTEADKKGGHLAFNREGKLVLRESAQCPKQDEVAFQDISKYKYFNTNNLWINLEKLRVAMTAAGGVLPLPLIKNSKTVDPRDKTSPKVFQLETAMGAAIEAFPDSGAVLIPRSRFAPVKTCSDLFALRSDAYVLSKDSRVVLDSALGAPLVKLDDDHYKLVDGMESHVGGYPSMRMCSSLTVKGSVFFEAGVLLVGDVRITNDSSEMKSLKAGSYQNETVVL